MILLHWYGGKRIPIKRSEGGMVSFTRPKPLLKSGWQIWEHCLWKSCNNMKECDVYNCLITKERIMINWWVTNQMYVTMKLIIDLMFNHKKIKGIHIVWQPGFYTACQLWFYYCWESGSFRTVFLVTQTNSTKKSITGKRTKEEPNCCHWIPIKCWICSMQQVLHSDILKQWCLIGPVQLL